jgi:hypothetical protein
MVFHTETRIAGKVDFYHHDSDINNQQQENPNMEISNKESTSDAVENQKTSNKDFTTSIGALLLAGLLMVTSVERPWSVFA